MIIEVVSKKHYLEQIDPREPDVKMTQYWAITPDKVYVFGYYRLDLKHLRDEMNYIKKMSLIRETHQIQADGSCEICGMKGDDVMIENCTGFPDG